ncbi:MAG: hypothetical protein ACPL1I_00785 [bacterium]
MTFLPMVGEGNRFRGTDFSVLYYGRAYPSGGFGFRNGLSSFREDVKMGLLRDFIRIFHILKGSSFDIIISVGDPFNLLFTGLGTHKKVFFISTDQGHSGWVRGFNSVERRLLRRYARWIFTRDRKTLEVLNDRGFRNVSYLGNPLMDCVEEPRFSLPKGITLLPGTRKDCWKNLNYLLDIIKEVPEDYNYYVPVNTNSESIILEALKKSYKLLKWDYGYMIDISRRVYIGKDIFSEMVNSSILVLGLSGSGNEQAAGLGKPVVSFYINGIQYNEKFINEQKRLLGDALILSKREDTTSTINELLRDPEGLERRGMVGRERMGEKGAIPRISEFIMGLVYESR